MNDLIFDYGWRKSINITFQGQKQNIELVFSAYKGQEILDIQKSVYAKFNANQFEYDQKVSSLIAEYVAKYAISNSKISPRTLLVNRDGTLALLCDCSWDKENGIAIVLEPQAYITEQDDLI